MNHQTGGASCSDKYIADAGGLFLRVVPDGRRSLDGGARALVAWDLAGQRCRLLAAAVAEAMVGGQTAHQGRRGLLAVLTESINSGIFSSPSVFLVLMLVVTYHFFIIMMGDYI
ncbi:hypothetical protein PQR14_34605 [Paraburkholderia bryophila]|uniref:hypothetical protein n=1 Tax=Burkholderiaceae TaxID=119060 RepID=UPI0012E06C7D|nr:hypothetical protein [Burkholderia sp. 9120]